MKIEAMSLADFATGEKREIAWICASCEAEREPGSAPGRTTKRDGFNTQLPTRKEALEHVRLPGKKTALLKG